MIFGGDAFVDLIGQISLMKDLTATMDITMQQGEDGELAQSKEDKPKAQESEARPDATEHASTATPSDVSGRSSGTSTPRRYLGQQAIMDKSEDARLEEAGLTAEEKELSKKEKKRGGLTKEQQERLAALEVERRKAREERVDTLVRKLIDRISLWTETDKGSDVSRAFEEKIRLEVENLKMESFGLEILHAIGATYLQKATSFLKSQKFLGISGFFSRLKDKGTLAKETWTAISTAIDAQMTVEEMVKLEERGGADWTDEKKAEFEKMVTGKILAAAWRGSKFEIQGVLRDVCDKVLGDKSARLEKRIERAHALVIVGTIYQKVCLAVSIFNDMIEADNVRTLRLSAILRRKVTTWPLSSSWQKQYPKRTGMRRKRKRMKRKARSTLPMTKRHCHHDCGSDIVVRLWLFTQYVSYSSSSCYLALSLLRSSHFQTPSEKCPFATYARPPLVYADYATT
jgi:X-domain of DnaJ-containing